MKPQTVSKEDKTSKKAYSQNKVPLLSGNRRMAHKSNFARKTIQKETDSLTESLKGNMTSCTKKSNECREVAKQIF